MNESRTPRNLGEWTPGFAVCRDGGTELFTGAEPRNGLAQDTVFIAVVMFRAEHRDDPRHTVPRKVCTRSKHAATKKRRKRSEGDFFLDSAPRRWFYRV
jgi:hypothetical protein